MKKIFFTLLVSIAIVSCDSTKKTSAKNENQVSSSFIDSTTVKKHLYTLASDEMEGRGTGTEGIEKAAKYIESEFKKIGLSTFEDLKDYRQTFTFKNRRTGEDISASNIIGVLEGKSRKEEICNYFCTL